MYNPEPETSRLEQVRGYLEAFHHLCEISAWQSAYQLLLTPTKTGDAKQLYEQLRYWGYYSEQIELFSRLLDKLDAEEECFCLQGLGRAYAYLNRASQSMSCYKQLLEFARSIGSRQAEAQALGGLVSVYSLLGQHQTVLNCLHEQLAIAREINARKEEGQALGGLGAYCILRGHYRRGLKYCQQAKRDRALTKHQINFFLILSLMVYLDNHCSRSATVEKSSNASANSSNCSTGN